MRAELGALGSKDFPLLALIALLATTGRFVADVLCLAHVISVCKASEAGSLSFELVMVSAL